MKINDTQRIGAYRAYQNNNEVRPGSKTGPKRKDEVQISEEAKELLGAQSAQSPEKAERIASLKQEVSSGTYHVETSQLVEKMLPFFRPIPPKE